mgnify:CR=1 FL=1
MFFSVDIFSLFLVSIFIVTIISFLRFVNSKGELYFKYPSLSELNYNLFRRVPTNTHNALIDVLVCLRCYCKIKENIDIFKICKELRLLLNV